MSPEREQAALLRGGGDLGQDEEDRTARPAALPEHHLHLPEAAQPGALVLRRPRQGHHLPRAGHQ